MVKLIFIPVILVLLTIAGPTTRWRSGHFSKAWNSAFALQDTSKKKVGQQTEIKTQPDERIFMVVEQQPEFVGGESARKKFIVNNMILPKNLAKRLSGKVFISFVVNTDGSIQDATAVKSLGEEYDQEGLRLVNAMPKWKPGQQSGRPVRVRYVLPISFP